MILLPLIAAAAVSSVTPESPCIGQTLEVCVTAIKSRFSIDNEALNHFLAENAAVDVNGKPLSQLRTVHFGIWSGSRENSGMVFLTLSFDNRVSSMSKSLKGFLHTARTQDEYDKTGIASAMAVIFDSSCWGADSVNLYKWFENDIKPTIVYDPVERNVSALGASESHYIHSPGIMFCGHNVRYSMTMGTDTNDITETNPHGSSFNSMIVVDK